MSIVRRTAIVCAAAIAAGSIVGGLAGPAADTWAATPTGPARTSTQTVAARPNTAPNTAPGAAACSGSRCVSPSTPAASCYRHTPELMVLGTDDVDYTVSADAPYRSGQRVIVTATATSGAWFAPAPPKGWVRLSAGTEIFALTLPRC